MTDGVELDTAGPYADEAERRLLELSIELSRAEWVYATYITSDSETVAARASARLIQATADVAKRSTQLVGPGTDPTVARRLRLMRLSLPVYAPEDPERARELTETIAAMGGHYGKAHAAVVGHPEPLDVTAVTRLFAESRDVGVLTSAWVGWHDYARPLGKPFSRYVALSNEGAREVGFADTGEMWRSKYDMAPDAFAREARRLWEQVRPLYLALHAFVRRRLREQYGPSIVPADGPIPAQLLGNIWAQSWDNLYPLVAPQDSGTGVDLTRLLWDRKTTPQEMVRYGERFFVSLGLDPLPPGFWERSLFVKPADRDVICHASAWDVDFDQDLRIKMCIDITGEDFRTIHHELGHNYYQRAYRRQPFAFRDSANDGFHEALGDTIQLSVTPGYLHEIGLLDQLPSSDGDLPELLRMALEKVAFLPFGLLIDEWRWKVFAGEIGPEQYTSAWDRLRAQYQGVIPPVPRDGAAFDPGAKFHIPGNTPYMRYFLAYILQFQFHRALSKTIGWSGPLHRCSIYGHREAGEKLRTMMEMGASRPWPEALEVLTGQRQMDASALLEYFAPLKRWLDEQNRGAPVGW